MPPIVKNLFLSKKFVVALLTAAGAVAMYFGYNVDPTKILTVLSPFLLYIGAQGWADAGKERAKIEQDTTLKTTELHIQSTIDRQKLAQEHELKLRAIDVQNEKMKTDAIASLKAAGQPGFAKLGAMLSSIVVCMIIGVTLIVACAHPGQVVLKTGQCVLDDGIFNDVLKALAQQNYVAAVEALALKDGPELVDCALQAAATPAPTPNAGSGSGSAELPKGALAPNVIVQRAREVLATRRAAGK